MYAQYSLDDFVEVKRLGALGLSDYRIAAALGFPRGTVQRWRKLSKPPSTLQRPIDLEWRPADRVAYSYLLGAYLGDGHIFQTSRMSWRLGITLDARYPELVDEIQAAIAVAAPESLVRRNTKPGAVVLLASSPIWTVAFPQHGPGRKHKRRIELAGWQREITHEHPRALLRGLIHSDGCRCVNRFKTTLPSGRIATYEYPRYFFTNLSPDIRGIFAEHCELLGIRWTQSSPRNLSVSRRGSVALLDGFVGPKR